MKKLLYNIKINILIHPKFHNIDFIIIFHYLIIIHYYYSDFLSFFTHYFYNFCIFRVFIINYYY